MEKSQLVNCTNTQKEKNIYLSLCEGEKVTKLL